MRITILILFIFSIISVGSTPALAKNKKHCPPGLAKKDPACVPPGLAKKGYEPGDQMGDGDYDILRPGDQIVHDGEVYDVVFHDGKLVLRRNGKYYPLPSDDHETDYVQVGDSFIKVDRKTKAVIEIFQLADIIFG